MTEESRETVLQEAMRAAIALIQAHGRFAPFGVIHTAAGNLDHINVPCPRDDAITECMEMESLLRRLRMQARGRNSRAIAVVRDLEAVKGSALQLSGIIRIDFEDRRCGALMYHLSYSVDTGHILTGQLITEPGTFMLFPARSEDDAADVPAGIDNEGEP